MSSRSLEGVELKIQQGVGFAPAWFADAQREAASGADLHAQRRQIVFAVACVESYFFEWVRYEILKGDFDSKAGEFVISLEYFPHGERRPLFARWRQLTRRLKSKKLIAGTIDYDKSPTWAAFERLVDFRNLLVHGGSSRPIDRRIKLRASQPAWEEFATLTPDWPVLVVRNLIAELHAAAGTTPPEWICASPQ